MRRQARDATRVSKAVVGPGIDPEATSLARRRMLGFERRPISADFEESDTVRLAQYVKFREEKFGGVLFETRSEKVFTLNPTATAVIREIASGDEATISSRLKERFVDQGDAIEREVSAFVADLRQRGLIEG
jgi:putative mycofactocin binding protein MftB